MVKAVEKSRQAADLPRASRPVDLVHLARQTLGDSQLEWEILQMFNQIAESYLNRLKADSEGPAATANLHALKGAALGVGAQAIAEQARAGENECRNKGRLGTESLADLELAIVEARTFIAEVLEQQAP